MELDILEKVFLLAVLKKETDETLNDIIIKIEATGSFSIREGKAILKKLKKENYIENGQLTFKGIQAGKLAEQEFKL